MNYEIPFSVQFLSLSVSLFFRPAQGVEWCQNYCSSCHELLANNEGLPGMTPILRPGGIGVKDGPLFDAVLAKTQGKEVGIPSCEGAASTKSPWNAPGEYTRIYYFCCVPLFNYIH